MEPENTALQLDLFVARLDESPIILGIERKLDVFLDMPLGVYFSADCEKSTHICTMFINKCGRIQYSNANQSIDSIMIICVKEYIALVIPIEVDATRTHFNSIAIPSTHGNFCSIEREWIYGAHSKYFDGVEEYFNLARIFAPPYHFTTGIPAPKPRLMRLADCSVQFK